MPLSPLMTIAKDIPHLNIRMRDYMNDEFAVKEEEIPRAQLFSTHADVYKNGTVFGCVIEKQKAQEVRQMLDKLFLGDGEQV